MDGRIDPGRALFVFARIIEPVLEYLQHDARRVAVAHVERQVIAFQVARERHHRAGLEMHEVWQIVVQGIPVPFEPLLRQQAAGARAWRAARADPSGRALAGCAHDQVDGAPDIGPLLLLVEIDRDYVHGVGMRDDVVSRLRDSANDLAMALRHDARDDHGRLDVLARERIEHAEDPAPMAVLRKADGIEVGHAGLERISHRADAGPMAVRPALKRATEEHRQSLAAGPPKIRRQGCLRGAGMYAELTHLTILSVDHRRLTNSDIFC